MASREENVDLVIDYIKAVINTGEYDGLLDVFYNDLAHRDDDFVENLANQVKIVLDIKE